MRGRIITIVLLAVFTWPSIANAVPVSQRFNDLDGLWNYYNYTYISDGRVVSLDEGGITTSEGQGYAMLRAVWSGDHDTFESVWGWTKKNLARDDNLFSWKWKNGIVDINAASDADTDIALALLLAAKRFDNPVYRHDALSIIHAIWNKEVLNHNGRYYLTGGNWAPGEDYPTIHVGYLAPYAYEVFAEVDTSHPWRELITSSYEILEWLFIDRKLPLPPEKLYLDRNRGELLLQKPGSQVKPRFSYDVFPLYWRVAADEQWFGRGKNELRERMIRFFEQEWRKDNRIFDRYSIEGRPDSKAEALPLYATLASLARANQNELAGEIASKKLAILWQKALGGEDTPYYLHNWLWFDRALELKRARSFIEFLAFLYPFDFSTFEKYLPTEWLLLFIALAAACKFVPLRYLALAKFLALVPGIYLCARYLLWRLEHSLNFIEPTGPYISIALLAAEIYCFSTVMLLLVQVGFRPASTAAVPSTPNYRPTVDVLIPIYSESLEILENTLLAARAMNYDNKRIYVCDDSHRDAVADMADKYGAVYLRGPREHAKAGNINNALTKSDGELVLIFDTDHIPVTTFLDETVPLLADPKVGFVQTAHHFYNPDIFQTSLRTPARVPDEQDMFHHGIQPARDKWGGAFFVGTGAVFRRKALEEVGGLLLMSITEDIHTSQHLHARGWESRYVGKNLAVGLNAENLASYLVQRTRWMQGCLQVFFRDNPLFTRGLRMRHRLGYFASQYYFLFPIARVIFFAAPLCFLLFHWHPIFADVSTLLAFLLPFMICLPVMSQLLLSRWPRVIWASAYENTISVALFRAIFDLILPKKLAFKVTPKGINSDVSAFDFQSSKYSLIVFAITFIAIVKGLFEFYYFGIEKDAYFFNLSWAVANLLLLITPLVIAREHPRYPYQNRIRKKIPVSVNALGFNLSAATFDIDQTGLSVLYDGQAIIPQKVGLRLGENDAVSAIARTRFFDKDDHGRKRVCFEFIEPGEDQLGWILQRVHCDPATWNTEAVRRTHSNLIMIFHFFRGLFRTFHVPKDLRRMQPRDKILRLKRLRIAENHRWALITNQSRQGLRVYTIGSPFRADTVSFRFMGEITSYQVVYSERKYFFLNRIGLKKSIL